MTQDEQQGERWAEPRDDDGAGRPAADGGDGTRQRDGQVGGELRAELVELTGTLCKAMNDPKRLMLLYALAGGPRSVGELTAAIGASQTNVSQHLAILRERGLVLADRHGARVMYALRYPELLDAIDQLRAILHRELGRRQELVAG